MQEEEAQKTDEGAAAEQPGAGSGFRKELWEIAKVVIISLAIVLPIRYYIAQPFIVRGASMEPNFANSEYLIVDEISYRFGEPVRGDVVVFRYPMDPRQFFIKRIVGLPGERIETRSGRIVVTGADGIPFTLEEPYLPLAYRQIGPDFKIALAADEYFVMGDNRNASSDSRVWGPLKRDLVVGKAFFRVWPPGAFGFVPGDAPAPQR